MFGQFSMLTKMLATRELAWFINNMSNQRNSETSEKLKNKSHFSLCPINFVLECFDTGQSHDVIDNAMFHNTGPTFDVSQSPNLIV